MVFFLVTDLSAVAAWHTLSIFALPNCQWLTLSGVAGQRACSEGTVLQPRWQHAGSSGRYASSSWS